MHCVLLEWFRPQSNIDVGSVAQNQSQSSLEQKSQCQVVIAGDTDEPNG